MKILLAIDSFKESMTSLEAAEAFARGFKRVLKNTSIIKVSISDGGEGFTESLLYATKGKKVTMKVKGPLGKPVKSSYGLFDRGRSAVVEMAKASGLQLIKPAQRNPMKTSTFGTGQLIDAALKRGIKKLVVGIGGSSTNDAGIGMAQALGVKLYDKKGRLIPAPASGKDLIHIGRMDLGGLPGRLKGVSVKVACDVDNPMTGKKGSAYVYGPQKGATPAMVKQLDAGLRHFCRVVKKALKKSIEFYPGAGAAGGLGGGLITFMSARLALGIDIMLDSINFKQIVKKTDLVITGEGMIDGQSVNNKAPIGVSKAAKKAGKPAIGICGTIGKGAHKVHAYGLQAVFSIVPGPTSLETAIQSGKANMERAGEGIARLLKSVKVK
jgi:glycerate kinase